MKGMEWNYAHIQNMLVLYAVLDLANASSALASGSGMVATVIFVYTLEFLEH